jgi:hypothetical protein
VSILADQGIELRESKDSSGKLSSIGVMLDVESIVNFEK